MIDVYVASHPKVPHKSESGVESLPIYSQALDHSTSHHIKFQTWLVNFKSGQTIIPHVSYHKIL